MNSTSISSFSTTSISISNIIEFLETKFSLAYMTIGIASSIFALRFIFGGKNKLNNDDSSKKRRKVGKKAMRFFQIKNLKRGHLLKFTTKEHKALENFSKLKTYAGAMNKNLTKEKETPKVKQELIFYQILNGMQDRFKQKTLSN